MARMATVIAEHLHKTYRVAAKDPGLGATLRHFFRRRYRTIEAVRDFSFQIEAGEIVGFLGPNGAGKTTTLKMLTGLIHPTAGSVSVAGHVPYRRQRAFQRRITLVMGQKQQLIWDLPALDSLRINAAIYEISDADFRARVTELSDMLDIHDELRQPVRKLSLGQRMKAELMAALLHRPEVLFLDEPTLGLDVNAQAAVRNFLRDYNRRYNATILLTSHYMADITALCRRVLLIHEGQLIYDGLLDAMVQRMSPAREVVLELREPLDRARLEAYGTIDALDGRSVRLRVGRDQLAATVGRIMAELPVADLTVTDPPIENVIGGIFSRSAAPLAGPLAELPNGTPTSAGERP
jgi:ABC-2 type transport system ATP-binding protein